MAPLGVPVGATKLDPPVAFACVDAAAAPACRDPLRQKQRLQKQRGPSMTDAGEPLSIDVVSDVVCPWCYLGEKRLAAALAEETEPVNVRWRPYQLDPTIPDGGLDRKEYMERKFGRDGRLNAVHDQLVQLGAEVGLPFAFDRITPCAQHARRAPGDPLGGLDRRPKARWSTACSAPISSRGATSATAPRSSRSLARAALIKALVARLLAEGADVEAVRNEIAAGPGDRRHRRAFLHFRRTPRRPGRAGRFGAAKGDRGKPGPRRGRSRRPERAQAGVERHDEFGGQFDGRGEIVIAVEGASHPRSERSRQASPDPGWPPLLVRRERSRDSGYLSLEGSAGFCAGVRASGFRGEPPEEGEERLKRRIPFRLAGPDDRANRAWPGGLGLPPRRSVASADKVARKTGRACRGNPALSVAAAKPAPRGSCHEAGRACAGEAGEFGQRRGE